jgi:hypothetical protein
VRARTLEASDLPHLRSLVNLHTCAVVPGWALSELALARHLEADESQPITGPWVELRTTLCVIESYRVLVAVHLLRYANRPR